MVEQGDDQLMHFKWKDRTTSTVEDDLIIFPDDVEFKKVSQCTTGRVFILKFKNSTRKLFFWMQEPKDDKDEEFCKKVNDYLNNPPAGGIPGLDLSNLGDSELQSLLNNMSQSQLMQLFGGGGGALGAASSSSGSTRQRSTARNAAAAATAAAASAASAVSSGSATTTSSTTTTASAGGNAKTSETGSANIKLSDLHNVLSGLPGASGSSGPSVDISTGLSTEVLRPLIENQEFVRKMKELLPEDEQKEDNAVSETLSSPQFRQALGMFSTGLQTGQLAPLIREFNLGDAAIDAATKGDMEAFVQALQNKKASEDKREEEDMALD